MKKVVYFSLAFLIVTILIGGFFGGAPASAQDAPPVVPVFPEDAREPVPASWPEEPGAMPALIGGAKADRPMVFSQAAKPAAPQSVGASTIDVWYGDGQKFGHLGNPQQWVNILGNVSATAGVKSLTYSLNGGPNIPLTVGPGIPSNPRLVNIGDFNIEIDYANLSAGANTVLLTATDKADQITQKSVTVNYTAGNTWSLPYNANWGSSSNIQDIAQVVDGNWVLQSGKLIPVDVGYDRLVTFGDESWTDYEVTIPVTVKSLDDAGFGGASNGPGIGLIMRWEGHTARDSEQPMLSWSRSGALGWYRWREQNGAEGLELRGYDWWSGTSTDKVWQFNTPYIIKMSVQSTPGSQRAYYRLKFWKQADPEPGLWDLEGYGPDTASQSGSVLLIAHHVEAEFGTIQVKDIKDLKFTLTTNAAGNGSIKRIPADKTEFEYGERVLIYAIPDQNHILSAWSGDFTGNENPLVVYMTKNTSVTANFQLALPGTLTVNVTGEGSVAKSPDKPSYNGGEVVTLTATPKPGHRFLEWTGDLTGSQNPGTIMISGDRTVTARFAPADDVSPFTDNFQRCELDTELWTFENPAQDSQLTIVDGAAQFTVPGGNAHTMWSDNRDAPRIMQNVVDAAFLVEAKFDTIPSKRYQIEGILVEQDADNWLRFDVHHNGTQVVAFVGSSINGNASSRLSMPINTTGASSVYVRVNRSAGAWAMSYSIDGTNWQLVGSLSQALTVSKVGVFAGNQPPTSGGSAPEFVARLDYFRNPSFPNDGGYMLMVDQVGEGEVQVSPEATGGYACGDQVTLQAVPAEGWTFEEWSGDVSSDVNPLNLTMDGEKSVTANFVEQTGANVYLPLIIRP